MGADALDYSAFIMIKKRNGALKRAPLVYPIITGKVGSEGDLGRANEAVTAVQDSAEGVTEAA